MIRNSGLYWSHLEAEAHLKEFRKEKRMQRKSERFRLRQQIEVPGNFFVFELQSDEASIVVARIDQLAELLPQHDLLALLLLHREALVDVNEQFAVFSLENAVWRGVREG